MFRVDKVVYKALQQGEWISVAYSRHLEHVYFVERRATEPPTVLYNTSLI